MGIRKLFARVTSWFREETGNVSVLAAVMAVPLLGMSALVLDGGRAYLEHRQAQNAADAAAWAAAFDIVNSLPAATAKATAVEYATRNGYTAGTNVGVSTELPPSSGPFTSTNFIRVVITKTYQSTLAKVFNINTGSITAQATAGKIGGASGPGDYAILALHNTECKAFEMTGSGSITVNNGGSIHVNSNCSGSGPSNAVRKTGSANITLSGGSGKMRTRGGSQVTGSGAISPALITGSPLLVPDPLATLLTVPAAGVTRNGTAAAPALLHITGSGTTNLQPGTYYGGIKYSGSGILNLAAGEYIMAGGGFEYSGSGTVNANGVMIYNTTNPTNPTGAGAPKPFNVSGTGTFNLTPPSSGTYKGLTFWQDTAISTLVSLTGSGTYLNGTFYFPSAKMKFAGSSNITTSAQLIASSFDLSGSGNWTNSFTSSNLYNQGGGAKAVLVN